jgi:hypothetical protein
VKRERTYVGLDVHARSVVGCGLDGDTGELVRARLCPQHEAVWDWLQQLPGPVAVTYEAGPTGFGLARFLRGRGVRCEVAAASKLQRPSGDRVRPTRGTRCCWPGCCDWARSCRSRSRPWRRKPPGTWSGPARTSAAI